MGLQPPMLRPLQAWKLLAKMWPWEGAEAKLLSLHRKTLALMELRTSDGVCLVRLNMAPALPQGLCALSGKPRLIQHLLSQLAWNLHPPYLTRVLILQPKLHRDPGLPSAKFQSGLFSQTLSPQRFPLGHLSILALYVGPHLP